MTLSLDLINIQTAVRVVETLAEQQQHTTISATNHPKFTGNHMMPTGWMNKDPISSKKNCVAEAQLWNSYTYIYLYIYRETYLINISPVFPVGEGVPFYILVLRWSQLEISCNSTPMAWFSIQFNWTPWKPNKLFGTYHHMAMMEIRILSVLNTTATTNHDNRRHLSDAMQYSNFDSQKRQY